MHVGSHLSPTSQHPTMTQSDVKSSASGSAHAVLRGFVKSWPAARVQSPVAMVEYLRRFETGIPVDAVMTPPEVEGRIFYDAEGHEGLQLRAQPTPDYGGRRTSVALLGV